MPVFSAAGLAAVRRWRISRTRSSPRRSTISPVPSVEPSSTTMTSTLGVVAGGQRADGRARCRPPRCRRGRRSRPAARSRHRRGACRSARACRRANATSRSPRRTARTAIGISRTASAPTSQRAASERPDQQLAAKALAQRWRPGRRRPGRCRRSPREARSGSRAARSRGISRRSAASGLRAVAAAVVEQNHAAPCGRAGSRRATIERTPGLRQSSPSKSESAIR